MFVIVAAGLGAIAGSFLNALSFRWGTGRSVLKGRSHCMHCGHTLGAWDLVPVASWVYLRGRCRYCGGRISAQYPLVECSAALLGVWTALIYHDPLTFAFWFVVHLILLFVLVYDLRHMIIPWGASLLLMALSGVYLFFAGADVLWWLSGPLLAAPLFLIFLLSRGRAMGFGDALLEVSLGWLMGFTMGLTALMLAFWLGAGVGIVLMLAGRRYTMKSEVPFGPFLITGAWLTLLFHADFFSTLPLFFF